MKLDLIEECSPYTIAQYKIDAKSDPPRSDQRLPATDSKLPGIIIPGSIAERARFIGLAALIIAPPYGIEPPIDQPHNPIDPPMIATTPVAPTTDPIVPLLLTDHCKPTITQSAVNEVNTIGSASATSGSTIGTDTLPVPTISETIKFAPLPNPLVMKYKEAIPSVAHGTAISGSKYCTKPRSFPTIYAPG